MECIGIFWARSAVLVSGALLSACASVEPRDAELRARAAAATTRAEHLEVSSLYAARADEERQTAGRHAAWAAQERWTAYALNRDRRYPVPSIMLGHCEALEGMHNRAADDDAATAETHRRMAGPARG